MHESAMKFAKQAIQDAEGKRVLEIGAYDVNGTVKWHVESQEPKIYIGTDLRKCDHRYHTMDDGSQYGCEIECETCADLAIPLEELTSYFTPRTFDILICTEVLEHVEDWRAAIRTMFDLTKSNGYMVITTRSPGFVYHEHPIDRWRFTKENMEQIFWGREAIIEDDPDHPGVFVKAWNDLKRWDGPTLNSIQVAEVEKK